MNFSKTLRSALMFVLVLTMMVTCVAGLASFQAKAADVAELVTFELGENGTARSESGTHKDTYSETATGTDGEEYTFSYTAGVKAYPTSKDSQGDGCIKLGTSSAAGGFTFEVPDNVTQVVIKATGRGKNGNLAVNGTDNLLSTSDTAGTYTEITVDTSSEKTITVLTSKPSGGDIRAYVNSITYYVAVASDPTCEHTNTTTTTTEPNGTEAGKTVEICDDCGFEVSKIVHGFDYSFSVPEGAVAPEGGRATEVVLPEGEDAPASFNKYAYEFAGWAMVTLDNVTTGSSVYAAGETVELESDDVVFHAVYTYSVNDGSGRAFVETALSDIKDTDVVVITMSKGGTVWALSSANGASSAPGNTTVVVADGKISGEVAEDLMWNIVNESGSLTIYVNGSTTTWLYCTAANNGVRVGNNANKLFTVDASSGYLKNTATSRYLGVYNNQDWRCYTNTTGNTAGQTLAFFVEKAAATVYYTTELESSTCDHTATEEVVVTAPTCTETGLNNVVCSNCGQIISSTIVDATGHTDTNDDGQCETCGHCEHRWSDWETVTEASKFGDGSEERTCGTCGETETQVVPAIADVELTIPEATQIGDSKASNAYTAGKYYVEGIIVDIANTTYGNLTIEDADGNQLYIYGCYSADGSVRYDAMDPQPAVGDTIRVYGVVGNYNGSAQMKYVWIVEHTVPAVEPEASITEVKVNVGADLALKYLVSANEAAVEAGMKLVVTFNGKTVEVEGVLVDGSYVFTFDGIAPHMMANNVAVQLVVGEEVVAEKAEDSVRARLLWLVDNTADEDTLALVKALLAYGNAAQKYTNYNEGDLADVEVEYQVPSAEDDKTLVNNTHANHGIVSAKVVFDSTVKVVFKVYLGSEVAVTLNGVACDLEDLGEGYYEVSTEALTATELGTEFVLVIDVEGENDPTLTYSVNAYAFAMVNADNAMAELAKALYHYGKCAEAVNG